jgi:lambda repressor-like predicted transcriptional regulator
MKTKNNSNELNPITARIFEELNRNGKSRYQLCKSIGIHESTLSTAMYNPAAWRNGKIFVAIANYLNVSPDYLITGKNKHYSVENDIIKKYESELKSLSDENKKLKQQLAASKKLLKAYSEIDKNLPAFLKAK